MMAKAGIDMLTIVDVGRWKTLSGKIPKSSPVQEGGRASR